MSAHISLHCQVTNRYVTVSNDNKYVNNILLGNEMSIKKSARSRHVPNKEFFNYLKYYKIFHRFSIVKKIPVPYNIITKVDQETCHGHITSLLLHYSKDISEFFTIPYIFDQTNCLN